MKRNGKYRFSLQFGSDTEEQIQVGELLERLGNKKSVVVIAAMMEYIHAHPEISEEEEKVEVSVSSGMGRFEVESLVRRIVSEVLSSSDESTPAEREGTLQSETTDADIEAQIEREKEKSDEE